VGVIFDSAAAIDIVSDADARGWPTNHLRNCPHCDVAAVRERGALNNEMEKDKRSYRRAGGCRIPQTDTPLMYINKRVTMIIMEKQELNFERCSQ
jgi:hypothetical protein